MSIENRKDVRTKNTTNMNTQDCVCFAGTKCDKSSMYWVSLLFCCLSKVLKNESF